MPGSGEPGPISPLRRRRRGRIHTRRRRPRPHTGRTQDVGEGRAASRQQQAGGRTGRGRGEPATPCVASGEPRAQVGTVWLGPRGPESCCWRGLRGLMNCQGTEGAPGALAHHTPPGQAGWLSVATPWSPGDPLAQVPQTMPVGDKQSGNPLLSSRGTVGPAASNRGPRQAHPHAVIPSLPLLVSLPSS